MTPDATDKFLNTGDGRTKTSLLPPGLPMGASSMQLASALGWPDNTLAVFAMRRIDPSTGKEMPGTYTEWSGVLNGNSVDSLNLELGDEQAYASDEATEVYITISATWSKKLFQGLTKEHNKDGSHKATKEFAVTLADAIIPVGTKIAYAGTKAQFMADPFKPDIFLFIEKGVTYNKADYPRLYEHYVTADPTVIVDTETFKFPQKYFGTVDVSIDPDDTDFNTLGKSVGSKTHKLTVAEMPSHNHARPGDDVMYRVSSGGVQWQAGSGMVSKTAAYTGGDQPHNNVQPSLVFNNIIKT